MKKIFYFIGLFSLFYSMSIGFGFGYFEEKMYCDLTKDNVVITLKPGKLYTCKKYIRLIEIEMKSIYRDILSIQEYIDDKSDIGYWRPLKDDKLMILKKLQNMRLGIISNMSTFENNLFEKSKIYFIDSISDYNKKLKKTYKSLLLFQDISSKNLLKIVEQQILNIEEIKTSVSFEQLNILIPRYIYLKNQIEGK